MTLGQDERERLLRILAGSVWPGKNSCEAGVELD